ncbi:MAG: hypothetical protein AB1405_10630, partial [Bdellovibrionota bacterium]
LLRLKLYLNEIPLVGLREETYMPLLVDPGLYYVTLVPYARSQPSIKYTWWIAAEEGKEYFVELDMQQHIYGFAPKTAEEALVRIPLASEMPGTRDIPPALPIALDGKRLFPVAKNSVTEKREEKKTSPASQDQIALSRLTVLSPQVRLFAENSETTAYALPLERQLEASRQLTEALSNALQKEFGAGKDKPARVSVLSDINGVCNGQRSLEAARQRALESFGMPLENNGTSPQLLGEDPICKALSSESGQGYLAAHLYGLEGQGLRNLSRISQSTGLYAITLGASLLFTHPVLSDLRKGLVLEIVLLGNGGKRVLAAGRKFSGGDAVKSSLASAAGEILKCFNEASGMGTERIDALNQRAIAKFPCRAYESFSLKLR